MSSCFTDVRENSLQLQQSRPGTGNCSSLLSGEKRSMSILFLASTFPIIQMFILMDQHLIPSYCTKGWTPQQKFFYFTPTPIVADGYPEKFNAEIVKLHLQKVQPFYSIILLKAVPQPSAVCLLFQMGKKSLLIISLNLLMGSICSSASIVLQQQIVATTELGLDHQVVT